MSLATRCPACSTVFRVVQDQLRVSEGWVRCGQCQEVFNALETLFDLAPLAAPEAPVEAPPIETPVSQAPAGPVPRAPQDPAIAAPAPPFAATPTADEPAEPPAVPPVFAVPAFPPPASPLSFAVNLSPQATTKAAAKNQSATCRLESAMPCATIAPGSRSNKQASRILRFASTADSYVAMAHQISSRYIVTA